MVPVKGPKGSRPKLPKNDVNAQQVGGLKFSSSINRSDMIIIGTITSVLLSNEIAVWKEHNHCTSFIFINIIVTFLFPI